MRYFIPLLLVLVASFTTQASEQTMDSYAGFTSWEIDGQELVLHGGCMVPKNKLRLEPECGSAWVFAKGHNGDVVINGELVGEYSILNKVENLDSFTVEYNGVKFDITDFQNTLTQTMRDSQAHAKSEIRSRMVKMGFAACIVILILVYALRFLVFAMTDAVKSIKKKYKEKAEKIKAEREAKRVARIAEDEAIRQTVANKTLTANGKELEILRTQIIAALDKNDTETARNLISVLAKLETAEQKS
ncbi:hypothetical protein L2750_14440 [Shewanella submarina]|uniref:Uncharacterized protein n=1 Tax=Shewanella submarina TaxID=2016376 RepID=A0ABV7G538_9GAMM|nr:hypothetical protein [Shewanella submarina]MCL1038329.1 hypothetical protein [Shewanella submarina]